MVLIRNASFDHITDADQKSVVLPIKKRNGRKITVENPRAARWRPRPLPAVRQQEDAQGPDPIGGRAGLLRRPGELWRG
ncbi:MAG: hypothetical protein WKF40_03885 [Thermoleophilaceae bacterium]